MAQLKLQSLPVSDLVARKATNQPSANHPTSNHRNATAKEVAMRSSYAELFLEESEILGSNVSLRLSLNLSVL